MRGSVIRTKTAHIVTGCTAMAITGALTLGQPAFAATRTAPRPPASIYAVTFAASSALYRLSPRTHRVHLVGRTRAELTDLAARRRTLFAIGFTELYTINPRTAAARAIGPLGVSDANALAARPSTGVLYGAGQAGELFTINPRTGATKTVGNFGHGLGSLGDLAFASGRLYASVFRSGSTASLLAVVNIRTGAAKVIGRMAFRNVYGLVAVKGGLFGATFGGQFLAVSERTGHARRIWADRVHVGGLTLPPA